MNHEDITGPEALAIFAATEARKSAEAALAVSQGKLDETSMRVQAVGIEVAASVAQSQTTNQSLESTVKELRARYDAVIGGQTKMLDGVRRYRMAIDTEVCLLESSLARLSKRIASVDELTAALGKLRTAAADPIIERLIK